MTDDDGSVGLRIDVDRAWPKPWTPRVLLRHPLRMWPSVRLWLLVRALDWTERRGWDKRS